MLSCSVMSNALQPHGLQPSRLLCPSGFCRQQYWSGLPCSPPGAPPNSGIEPRSPALQAYSLPSEPPGKLISTQIEHELYWRSHPLLPAEFTVTRWCRYSGSKRTSWGLAVYLWQHTRLRWEWAKPGPPCSPFSKLWILKVCHSVLPPHHISISEHLLPCPASPDNGSQHSPVSGITWLKWPS